MMIPILVIALVATPPFRAEAEPKPPQVVPTLQMNPEKPRKIVGWWVGPDGLIEVCRDGRYRRWSTIDRFVAPAEQGRWHRDNHAVFWLEPYTIPKVVRRRAAMWLRDDVLMSDLTGDDHPFEWRRSPPGTPADSLIGCWEGPGGTLQFETNRRFVWSAPRSDDPAMVAGQRGIWGLEPDGTLTLMPMLPHQPPAITVDARSTDGRILKLRSSHGTLIRRPAPPSPESDQAKPSNPSDPSTGTGHVGDDPSA